MPTQERAVVTRASIVQGAAVVFDERGYANASLDLIAEQANVTRGALYFHFKAKDALANAVIEEQHRISRSYAEHALTEARSALEGMIRMSAGLARQLTTEVVVSAGIRLTTDGTASELSAKDPYRDWMDTFVTLIGLAIEQGDFRDDVDPVRVAGFIIPAYTGVQLVSDTLHDRADLFERVSDLWSLLLPGLVRPERLADATALLTLVAP
ncbi:TetR family transcriptional regulator [Frondihabitans sucicola]|uniref:TetR family transcriptional regulator n=1 Tax=Frondihabitans sucicola TaxID=1268041 RepID=A0ABN6XTX2_9MICO|nr:ScbR family autoregulator-binding transcription factor [Frondihabitans sucicola]BDZ48462.1 TetR family transcriptional regulator [Frondihabitans sucicola]